MSKSRTIICFLGSLALAAGAGFADLIVYEGFEYDRRQWTESGFEAEGLGGLNGGFGWAAPWEETAAPLNGVAAEARDATGAFAGARVKALFYTDSRGNQLLTRPGQARLVNDAFSIRPLPRNLNVPGETVWLSFLAQGQADLATGFAFFSLNHNGGGTIGIRLGKINGTEAKWGIQASNDPNVVIATGPSTTETVFYLLRMDFPENTEEDIRLSLWFNPDLESEADLGEPDVLTGATNREINYALLRGRLSIDVDEIRIGTTFASVTPHGPFQEGLKIDRAVTVKFDTEFEKKYEIQSLRSGMNWETVLVHTGDGQPFETSLPIDPTRHDLRVILVTEPRSPNPSSDPELTVVDGLRLHLDASAAESLTIDGLRVTEWRDRAGNDIVFTPMVTDTDTRPFYWASGPNGRPVLAFDQSAMESNSPAALSLANHVEGITFFAVAQNMQGGAQNIFRMSTGANPTGIRFVQYRTGGLNAMQVRSVDSGSALTLNGGERISGEWGIDSSVVDFMSGISFLYRDGEEVASGQNIGEPGRSVATDSLVVRVGASTSPSLANTWEGDIAEILFYDRVLSHEERNQVGQYLSDKYNIPYRFILNEAVSYEVIPTVTLRFVAEGDAVYRIEGSRDLSGGWEDLGVELEGLGFGERAFLTIEDEVSREFYRLRKL